MQNLKLGTLAAAALACLLQAGAASAVTLIRLDATSLGGAATDFSLTFEDLDDDALFSLDELRTFTGINWFGAVYTEIRDVPEIPQIADGGNPFWTFFRPAFGQSSGGFNLWSYSLTTLPTTIPEPTTLSLLGLSLAGLGWRMRRQGS